MNEENHHHDMASGQIYLTVGIISYSLLTIFFKSLKYFHSCRLFISRGVRETLWNLKTMYNLHGRVGSIVGIRACRGNSRFQNFGTGEYRLVLGFAVTSPFTHLAPCTLCKIPIERYRFTMYNYSLIKSMCT